MNSTESDKTLLINWNNVCSGCMRELTDEEVLADSCPQCGFSPSSEVRTDCLPDKTILNGKYIIGRLLSKNETTVTYLGYDLNLQTLLQIEELFPADIVIREEKKATVLPASTELEEDFEARKEDYISISKQEIKDSTQHGDTIAINEIFQENNTVYKVLRPVSYDTHSEVLDMLTGDSERSKSRKKIAIFAGIISAILIITAIVLIVIFSGKEKGEDTKKDDTQKETNEEDTDSVSCYNPAFLTGTYYSEDKTALLSIGNGIYFCREDENGTYGPLYPLISLGDNLVAFITCDEDNIYYTDGLGNGVYALQVNSDTIEPKLITSNPAWSVKVTDKYVYYSNIDSLYRVKKDGSNEIVICKTASDYFSLTDEKIYFYSEEDGYIYSCEPDGSNIRFLLNSGGISDLLVIDDYMYINQAGSIYKYDLISEKLIGDSTISGASDTTELFELNGYLYFIAENDSGLIEYDPEKDSHKLVFDEIQCMAAAPLGDRILLSAYTGEYYIFNPDDNTSSMLNFNYYDVVRTQDFSTDATATTSTEDLQQ